MPVVAGTPDSMSAAVGSGAVADHAAHLYVGTSAWLSCHVPYKRTDPLRSVASLPAAIPGRYLVSTEQQTAGACLERLRDVLLPGAGDEGYAELERLAATAAPGAGGVVFTPWLNGERTPVDDHLVRGGLHNLTLASGRADIARAVLEGVALNARWMQQAVERFCRRRLDPIAFIGGGARSALWAQIMADVLGRRVQRVADPSSANLRGAALLAFTALGEIGAARPARARQDRRAARAGRRHGGDVRDAVRGVQGRLQGEPPVARPARDPARREGGDNMSEDPLQEIVATLRPYRDSVEVFERLPEHGRARADVLADLETMAAKERARWEDGFASGAVYHGDPEHVAFLAQAYALHSQHNPLHVDLWPSTTKLEAEIVAMTADLLGAGAAGDEIGGVVTSGGTESIMLAVKAHRDRAADQRAAHGPPHLGPRGVRQGRALPRRRGRARSRSGRICAPTRGPWRRRSTTGPCSWSAPRRRTRTA